MAWTKKVMMICGGLLVLLLTACKENPDTDYVVSKEFDNNIKTESNEKTENIHMEESFLSVDKKITFDVIDFVFI